MECPICRGEGAIVVRETDEFEDYEGLEVCEFCGGKGEVRDEVEA